MSVTSKTSCPLYQISNSFGVQVVARREPVEDVALIGTDAGVRVHRGVRVVAHALHQDDARRLQHRVHRALEQRIATVRSAGLAGAQVQDTRTSGRLLANEIETFEHAHGVSQVGDLIELRCGQMHEHDVRFGSEANLGAGFPPVAGHDVADVCAMRACIGRIGAGGVVVERGKRVEILEGRIDRRTRQQAPIVVRRRSQRIVLAALIPQRLKTRRAVRVAKVRVREVETPVANPDNHASAGFGPPI